LGVSSRTLVKNYAEFSRFAQDKQTK
jgi:hypothetical protein